MQAIEVIVFLAASLMIGTLILMFITNFNFSSIAEALRNLLVPQDETASDAKKLEFNKFTVELANCWQKCAYGTMDLNCGVYNVLPSDSNVSLNEAHLEQYFRKYNICETCNIKIDGNIELPAVLAVYCDANTNTLVISE